MPLTEEVVLFGFQFFVTSYLANYSYGCQSVDYSTSPLGVRVGLLNLINHIIWAVLFAMFLRTLLSSEPVHIHFQMASVCGWFFFSKIVELLDTVPTQNSALNLDFSTGFQ